MMMTTPRTPRDDRGEIRAIGLLFYGGIAIIAGALVGANVWVSSLLGAAS